MKATELLNKMSSVIGEAKDTSDAGFQKWLKEVNIYLGKKVGCSYDDLVDYNWRDAFDDGVKATSAANKALKNSDFNS